jgi:4-diphosphocytidyl-2-C-methyl-D-erythritol kinase
VGDTVRAAPAVTLSLALAGPFAPGLAAEPDNLVLRAARWLAEAAGVASGAHLTLDKHLPIASGIGGGSADAAAALRVLARLWGVTIPDGLAARLGADVPVCLAQAPARMGGVGDQLGAAPALPRFGMVLVNPGIAVPTPDVFRARAIAGTPPSAPAALPAAWADTAAMVRDLRACRNDLQAAAIALCPAIAEVLAALGSLPGCRLARMSGSGATCFAIFDSATAAEAAARRTLHPAWWVWGGDGADFVGG